MLKLKLQYFGHLMCMGKPRGKAPDPLIHAKESVTMLLQLGRKAHMTFVGKVMSLFLNTLSMLVITFFPRSKCLLISWLQSPSAVILKPLEIKFLTVSQE